MSKVEEKIELWRKKPVVIEARQLTVETHSAVREWCGGQTWSRPRMRAVTGLTIPTLEGAMNAEYGDWIIRGVQGEFYPCKPDIFAATYEPASERADHRPDSVDVDKLADTLIDRMAEWRDRFGSTSNELKAIICDTITHALARKDER